MNRPSIDKAPGLAWRKRADGWVATWIARQDIVKKGYSPSTQRLHLFTATPSDDEIRYIRSECGRLQDEMLAFGKAGPDVGLFDGTVQGLVDAYQRDPDSPYRAVRYKSRKNYDAQLKQIGMFCGTRALHAIGARDFKQWYQHWRYPDGKGGKDKPYTAYSRITLFRQILSYGVAFEVESGTAHCLRLKTILGEMKFQNGTARTQEITRKQAMHVIVEANVRGVHSIALAQALQFELAVHQKDCIGEWVPMDEPGLSGITRRGQKWLYGIHWEEIDANMILRHQMAKARKLKLLEFDLKLYPMVMAELNKVPSDQRSGPLVIRELDQMPWPALRFAEKWREIARAVGVPDTVRNMDSRAGATTETIEATGGNLEAARKQAGHDKLPTTQRYSRGVLESNSKVAVLRQKHGEKKE